MNRRRPDRRAAALGLAGLLVAGCSGGGTPERPSPAAVVVAVSVAPLGDLVEAVGGDRVTTVVALPSGADPHTFEPSPRQMASLEGADLAVSVGGGGLPWEESLLGDADRPALELVPSETGRDPHAWIDLALVADLVPRLVEALADADPGGEAVYRERGAALATAIEELRDEVAARLSPYAGRAYFVDHPAWSRLTAPHGLEERALEAGHREPTPAALAARIGEARELGARTLFVRPGPRSPAARTFLEATGADPVVLDPLALPWSTTVRRAATAIVESLDAS